MYIIYFVSKENENNKGYFQKMGTTGFWSTVHKSQATQFSDETKAKKQLEELKEKEGQWYNFLIEKI